MAEKKTERQYKRTFRNTVGTGMSALAGGSGRRYFVLEHRDNSKYHKAGESQKIIIDHVELGCNSDCQVRFDQETWGIVSRRHAAIVREGDRWKLIHLSTVNSTFLNGRKIDSQWYLESGDEIQLAVGGPRLGFIAPEGRQGLVSSIRMTERLELFRKQALKPYKRAIAAMAILLILAIGGLSTWNILQKKDFESQMADARATLSAIQGKNSELDSLLAEAKKEQKRQDSLIKVYRNLHPGGGVVKIVYPDNALSTLLTKVEGDIFYIRAKVVLTKDGETIEIPNYGWSGTGFLTSDGKFITAKHCVEGWKYKLPTDTTALNYLLVGENTNGCEVRAVLTATSKTKTLHFTSNQFVMDHNGERNINIGNDLHFVKAALNYTDWAYANATEKGSIVVDKNLAANLPIGADLHLLGFPLGMGAEDTYSLSPLYGSCKTSKAGLESGIIRISARNYESGNSGGPVFYNDKGKLKAVGVVSYSVSTTTHGGITSISNIH